MAKTNPRRANGAKRNRIRRQIAAQGKPCALCGLPIDYEQPYKLESGAVNPRCFVVDEILPVSRGGNPLDIANCQPAHYECNAKKGNMVPCESEKTKPILHSVSW